MREIQQSEEVGHQKEPLVALVWVFAMLSVIFRIVGVVPGSGYLERGD